MKWIPVKLKLPPLCKKVLCLHEDRTICIEARLGGGLFHGEFYYDELYGPVTHWMPLPKPPRGGDANYETD